MANDPLPDPSAPLPGGIVKNTEGIYDEVGGRVAVPVEDIGELWKVYTRTAKKVKDPTSKRLEAFWWHVWGSDRRYLSGRTLARIYEDISTGPTFVPLRGEDAPVPPLGQQPNPPAPRGKDPQRSPDQGEDQGEGDLTRPKKERTSSSAKPPPKHSILKKPRGPSASGPRPTARFVSPDHSDDETKGDGEGESSGSATATASNGDKCEVPGSKPEKKSTPPMTKKFVAGSKRRPVLGRRPSSQSSTGSEVGSRETMSSSGSRLSGGRNVPTIAEHVPKTAAPTSLGSSESPTTVERPVVSEKAAGKRPAARPAERRPSKSGASVGEAQGRPLVVQQAAVVVPQTRSLEDVRRNMEAYQPSRARNEPLRTGAGGGRQQPSAETTNSRGLRGPVQAEPPRLRELSIGRAPPQGLLSSTVAATSKVAAQGTFDSEHPDPSGFAIPAPVESPGLGSRRPSSSSVLEPRFTPTPPSSTPSVPFGRSKSQLTLLLEREKARIGDIRPKSIKEGQDEDKP